MANSSAQDFTLRHISPEEDLLQIEMHCEYRIAHPFGLARVCDFEFEGVLHEIYIKKVDFNLHHWKAVYISFSMGYLNQLNTKVLYIKILR